MNSAAVGSSPLSSPRPAAAAALSDSSDPSGASQVTEAEQDKKRQKAADGGAVSSTRRSSFDSLTMLHGGLRGAGKPEKAKAVSSESRLASIEGQWQASALPRTKLGDFLELIVRYRLEQSGHADVAGSVTVRMVSNTQNRLEVPHCIRENFQNDSGTKVPLHLPYRQKCIILFQKIDGLDVCLFCLYVQEFDESCPEPNKSRVYVAYLDSVEYFRPRECRTMVYQELMSGYLKWAQVRGFKQCHIWACPPQRGDNFIFWCHPPHQRTPSRDRLTAWYNQIVKRSLSLAVFAASKGVDNLWGSFFSRYNKKDDSMTRLSGRVSIVSRINPPKNAKKGKRVGRPSAAVLQARALEAAASQAPAAAPAAAAAPSLMSSLSTLVSSVCASLTPFSNSPPAVTSPVFQAYPETAEHKEDEDGQQVVVKAESSAENATSVPLCPPIFEGDFWVNECLRVYKYFESKVKGDAAANNSDSKCVDKIANQRGAREILRTLMTRRCALAFLKPVDPVALGIPDYPSIITRPMDLGSIREKLRSKSYSTLLGFAEVSFMLIVLCFSSCLENAFCYAGRVANF